MIKSKKSKPVPDTPAEAPRPKVTFEGKSVTVVAGDESFNCKGLVDPD